jgi:hypothetical protein
MASIGGFNGPRGTLFHGSATDSFSVGRNSLGGSGLGVNTVGLSRYDLAKKELAQYDTLVERTKRIGNKVQREQLIDTYGLAEPENKDKSLYARNVVAGDLANAESYTPINYDIYTAPGPAKNRPGRLKDWNSDFAKDVKYAEDTYGILPEAQVIERTTTVSQVPGWVVPVTIGAAAVAALAVFGVFNKK